jgi:hypothetical protein
MDGGGSHKLGSSWTEEGRDSAVHERFERLVDDFGTLLSQQVVGGGVGTGLSMHGKEVNGFETLTEALLNLVEAAEKRWRKEERGWGNGHGMFGAGNSDIAVEDAQGDVVARYSATLQWRPCSSSAGTVL